MLVAYGPDNLPVVAEEMPLVQLQHWSRERQLYCPNCRGNVHVRGGPEKRTQIHFAHQRGECAWSTEAESVRHMRGKVVLAHWLREQFPQAHVTLEERLPEPNRIADIFVAHTDGQRWAIEFQCAPLELDEWQQRHSAYRKASIIDTWIIGTNRREKQEAFIEAILAAEHEILFLDPLVTPPRVWLRWPVPRQVAQEWQNTTSGQTHRRLSTPLLAGWVGNMGYGATLIGSLEEIHFNEQVRLIHPARAAIELRTRLLQTMSVATLPDETLLRAYLRPGVGDDAVRVVFIPLLKAYLRDPDLLRRYNYGRGLSEHPLSDEDRQRVQKAREWMLTLARRGYSASYLLELMKEIPFVGPYAAFAQYIEMLVALSR